MRICKINIWFGWVPLFHLKLYPKFSFFNGGKYWKFSIYWLKYLLEFSGPKRNNIKYKVVTKEEFDRVLNEDLNNS